MTTSVKFHAYLRSAGWTLEYFRSLRAWTLRHQDGRTVPVGFDTLAEVWEWWDVNAPMAFREAARAHSLMRRAHSSHRAVRDALKTWALSGDDEVLGKHACAVAKAAYRAAKIHPQRWRSDLVKLSLGML